jgi:hypothetical protein
MQLDFAAGKYSFLFCPERNFDFQSFELRQRMSLKFPSPIKLVAGLSYEPSVANAGEPADIVELLQCFPGLFSDRLGTVKGMVCHLDLSDNITVRSRSYQCSPPL